MAVKRLTARFTESVSTELSREDFSDALVRGLQLRVTAQGAKSWAFRYTRPSDGRRRRLTLGTFPAMTLDEARKRAREESVAVERGGDPAAKVAEQKMARTFAEVADEWIKRHAKPNKSERSVRDDLSMLQRHILPAIGPLKAERITKRDVIELLDSVAAKDDARANKEGSQRRLTHRPNRVFALVRSIFRWALGRDIIKEDPTAGISAPIKKEKPRERELSPDEICTFLASTSANPNKTANTAIRGRVTYDAGNCYCSCPRAGNGPAHW